MRLWISVAFIACVAGGCAGPMLNEYTVSMAPTIGTLETRQALENLARFVKNPWAVPGHVELSNGQIQVTNQVGANLKFPITRTAAPTGITHATGYELDVNPAQTQDQESYSLLPVTDDSDLRRLRALYHYAVCADAPSYEREASLFSREWDIADQKIFQPPPTATKPKPPKKTAAEIVTQALKDFRDGTLHSSDEVIAEIQKQIPSLKITDDQKVKAKKEIEDAFGEANKKLQTATSSVLEIFGILTPFAAPGGGAKPSAGQKSDTAKQSGGGDTVAFEDKKKRLILSEDFGLGAKRWLYWKIGGGEIKGYCPGLEHIAALVPDPQQLLYLGSALGVDFYTDDPKKFSDFVLFALGAIPNTTGSHVLDSGSGSAAKTNLTQPFVLGGQYGQILPGKGNR